jgi:amino acid adenylation domain-containing protein
MEIFLFKKSMGKKEKIMENGDNGRSFSGEITAAAGRFVKEKNYWLKKLSGDLEKSIFLYDHKKHSNERNPDTVKIKFSREISSRLLTLSNGSDARLFIIMVTALVLLIDKYSGKTAGDVILGVPVTKQDIEGSYVNTVLALRNRFNSNMTFKELLLEVRKNLVEANENHNYPIETLLYKLNIPFTKNDDFPLFDIAVLLENIHDRKYLRHINLNMIFSFERSGGSIEGKVDYNAILYEKRTVEQIAVHFDLLLRHVLWDVDQKINRLVLFTEEEKIRFEDFCNTRADYPANKTIHRLFEDQAARTPDCTAVAGTGPGPFYLDYRELDRKSNQLARLLRRKGVQPDTIVAVMVGRSPWVIIAILGILKAGGAYMPIEDWIPGSRIKSMLEDSGASLLLTDADRIDNDSFTAFQSYRLTRLTMDEVIGGMREESRENLEYINRPRDLAYVIFTSGSTGNPRGVMIEHRALVNYTWGAAKDFVKNERLNFPLYTSLSFDLTVTSIFTPLITGNTVVVYDDKENVPLIEKIIDENKAGIIKGTPSHLKLIREKKIESNSVSIKRFIVGGEAFASSLARDIYRNFKGRIEIYNEYGPTEATVGCMLYKYSIETDFHQFIPIGKPTANYAVYLLDSEGNPVPVGAVSEIYISGAGLARGYMNRPELTAEKFIDIHHSSFITHRLYRTGDLARWLPDGNIEFLGRVDEQVKIRGARIEMEEIERVLLKKEEIREAVVSVKEDKSGDKYLSAYFVSQNALSQFELKEFLSKYLPAYMIPSHLVPVEKIPLTPNGKVDRKALPEPGIKSTAVYVPPGNGSEGTLVEIWSEILGVEKSLIGIDANFFELGGHSLKATILTANIHKELDVEVPLAVIFKTPTIRGLAGYIEKAGRNKYLSIEPVEEREYYPLSSAQKRMHFLQQLDLTGTVYNISFVLPPGKGMENDKLEAALKKLIARHESLRTFFQLKDGEPVQRIHEEVEFEVEYFDLAAKAVARHPKTKDREDIINNFVRSFDLSRPPLLRVGLINTGEGSTMMMVDMHHIISDATSQQILVKDFFALYKGEQLPALKLHYKDYSQWYNSEKTRDLLKRQEKFWLKEFAGEIPVLNIPTDYERPAVQTFAGRSLDFALDEDRTRLLRKAALDAGATMYAVTLAIFNILLAKLSGDEDIVVGTAAAGRRHADLQHIIGMLVNTLAFRSYPSGDKTFAGFLKEVKEKTIKAFDNQEYPLEQLVEKLGVNRDKRRNPLFDVGFSFHDRRQMQHPKEGGKETAASTGGLFEYDNPTAKYDLVLHAVDSGEKLFFTLEYKTKLFKKETVELTRERFLVLIDSINADGDVAIKDLEYRTPVEVKLEKIENVEFNF